MINDFFKVSKPIPKAPVVASIRGPAGAPDDYREPEFKLPKKPHELRLEILRYKARSFCLYSLKNMVKLLTLCHHV